MDLFLVLADRTQDLLLSDPIQLVVTCHWLCERHRKLGPKHVARALSEDDTLQRAREFHETTRAAIKDGQHARLRCDVQPDRRATFDLQVSALPFRTLEAPATRRTSEGAAHSAPIPLTRSGRPA